jgi:CRP-like cAMP-binding protein
MLTGAVGALQSEDAIFEPKRTPCLTWLTTCALPYFEGCAQDPLDLLVAQAVKRHFEPGEANFHEGDPALSVWLIERGSVKIFKLSLDGIEHIRHLLGEGNTFNDIVSFDGGANPANAAALSGPGVTHGATAAYPATTPETISRAPRK